MIAIRRNPYLIEDMIHNFDPFAMVITSISVGYFVYDLIDMLRSNNWNPMKMKEMTVHHLCCISCLGLAVVTKKYMGLSMLVLNMEINSIFLHTRALLQYCQYRSTVYFAIAAFFNIVTNITHRQLVGAQLLIWSYQTYITGEDSLVIMSLCAGSIILILNIKLLFTCVRNDYFRTRKPIQ